MRAMILAAGRGQRMRPLTDTTPKPLLMAGSKPLIVWHIERLVQAGIPDIVINLAWLGAQIEHTLQDGRQFGARITYSAEPTALETAGGIAQALDFFCEEPFLVINGDIWCDWDPAAAAQWAQTLQDKQKLAWLLLIRNPMHHPDGDFSLDDTGAVIASETARGLGLPALTFTGIGIYQPALFGKLKKGQAASLAPLLRHAIADGQAIGQHYHGAWIDVGTPERLDALGRSLGE